MADPVVDQAVAAVREAFADADRWEGEGIHPVEVIAGAEEVLVVFRWQRNPHLYAFPVPAGDLAVSVWTGEPVKSAQEWAQDVAGWIEEELLTGYVARATRRFVDGRIELREPDWSAEPVDDRFDIAAVEDDGLPALLAELGFDVAEPLRLRAGGQLLGWYVVSVDDTAWTPVGHAATRWQDTSTSWLVNLETAPGLPVSAILELVGTAVGAAADAGATSFISDMLIPHGEILGFRATQEGLLLLDTDLRAYDEAAMNALLHADLGRRHNYSAGTVESGSGTGTSRHTIGAANTAGYRNEEFTVRDVISDEH